MPVECVGEHWQALHAPWQVAVHAVLTLYLGSCRFSAASDHVCLHLSGRGCGEYRERTRFAESAPRKTPSCNALLRRDCSARRSLP